MARFGLRLPRVFRGPSIESPLDAPVLTLARITLRPHRLADAASWYALQSNAEVLRYLPWPARDRRDSRAHLRHRTHHTRLYQADDFMALAIELDGTLIGDVSLHLRSVKRRSRLAELSWLLDPDYGGHGYATEAAEAMLDLAFGALGAKWVTALIASDNRSSLALAERLGFHPVTTDGSNISFLTTADLRVLNPGRSLSSSSRVVCGAS